MTGRRKKWNRFGLVSTLALTICLLGQPVLSGTPDLFYEVGAVDQETHRDLGWAHHLTPHRRNSVSVALLLLYFAQASKR